MLFKVKKIRMKVIQPSLISYLSFTLTMGCLEEEEEEEGAVPCSDPFSDPYLSLSDSVCGLELELFLK